jgi:hypothetical protein
MGTVPEVAAPAPAAEPEAPPRSAVWPGWADPVLIAAVFVVLAVWTWGGCADVLIDFGRELYVAWRISEGDVLYRDVASFYGPLSPHLDAAWFRLFGVGLRTLALGNLAILAATVAALWLVLGRGAEIGRWAPTAGAVVFLAVCGFAQLHGMASFNFVAPYSHEATHGFALAVFAVLASLRLLQTARVRWALAAGVCCGLSFLTKPESFVAALGASGAVTLLALAGPGRRPPRLRAVVAFAGGLAAVVVTAFALLATRLPASTALTGLLGSWAYAGRPELRRLPYFAWSAGTADLTASLKALLLACAWHAAVLVPAGGLAWLAGRRPRLRTPLAAGGAAAVLLALVPTWRAASWLSMPRPLTLWALGACGLTAWALARARHDPAAFGRHAARFALSALALLLLPRIFLNARLYHYGFVLAGPALLVLVAAVLDWIPAALARRGASAAVFRSAALAALAVVVGVHVRITADWMRVKRVVVGAGADRIRADPRGAFVEAALQGIARTLRPGETLVVLPEGVMVNYLLRVPSSIPYLTMLPTEVAIFGEEELFASLRRRPPSYILLVHRETVEYGQRFFGRDYARPMMEWIRERYARVGGAGDPPLQPGSNFGMALLRRREGIAPGDDAAAAPP